MKYGYAIIVGATLIWLAAVVSPGPNFLIVSRLALTRSRRSAIGATFGIAVGSVAYAALTMFGVSVLILRFAVLTAGGVIEVAWYTTVSFTLSSRPMRAGYQRVRRTVDRVLGTLLIPLGLKVALDAR